MPPTNIDFTTAIDIGTSLPYTTTQDVRDAGTNFTVYYKYTGQPGDSEIGVFGFGELSPGYQPRVRVYLGPAGAPTLYTAATHIGDVNKPIQVPVLEGQELFFEFISFTGNTPDPAVLNLSVVRAPDTAVAEGDIFVSDDSEDLPAVIIDGATGDIKRFINPFPAGEAGDILTDGTILHENLADGDFKLFDSDFNLVTTVAFTGVGTPKIRTCNGGNCFYVGYPGLGGTQALAKRVANDGTIGSTIGPFGSAGLNALAAKNDETILYYCQTRGGAIERWDIGGNVATTDLVAGITDHFVEDILYLDDDTIIALYFDPTTKSTQIKVYDTSGTTLNTFNLGTSFTANTPRLAYALDNPDSFWVWTHPSGANSGKSVFTNILVSDGSTITTFTIREFESGAYNGTATETPDAQFGPSFSCPFFILRVGSGPTTATLTVIKVTSPTDTGQTFDFTTTGGLSPDTFNLGNGDSQVYSDVAPGTYGIIETVPAHWAVDYAVSNGDPNDAIVLAAGDNVTVVVTNTLLSTGRGGIYKLVENKRNDTLWIDVGTGDTEDVKIPDPSYKTGLIGQ